MILIDYKKRWLDQGPHLFGLLFMIAGTMGLVCPWVVELTIPVSRAIAAGAIFLVVGFAIFTTYAGIQIDPGQRRFRHYQAIVGIKRGVWEPLESPGSLRVVTTEHSFQTLPNGVSPSFRGKVKEFILVLEGTDQKEVILHLSYRKMSQARKKAQLLAQQLKVPLRET